MIRIPVGGRTGGRNSSVAHSRSGRASGRTRWRKSRPTSADRCSAGRKSVAPRSGQVMHLRSPGRSIDEVREAVFRYSAKSARRVESFLKNFRHAIERIRANPRTYPLEDADEGREIRSISVDKLPYSVIYELLEYEIVMLGLWHQHGEGEDWSRRES